ncbi:hypothetical protein EV138_5802 [Kribbella voronezhensis]|uniref:DUF1269 domain-containing protein n=1 Tax=Kribbella voronezhensis TaxID=2512212 RepID=A0A4R7SY17_9ACTN|nr:DUF6325 family protein [Kribbella voronezhensis]TDU83338.1 hypothetical protein EV138_5802 [Kribbella voronezhensis]
MPDQAAEQVLGPIDLLVVEIPATGPGPRGLGALLSLAERDLVRILDLEVVGKAADGTISLIEPDTEAMPELAPFIGSSSGLLDEDDLREAGAFLEAGANGIVVIYENEWIASMEVVLRQEGARLVAAGRIPAADFEAALGGDGEDLG